MTASWISTSFRSGKLTSPFSTIQSTPLPIRIGEYRVAATVTAASTRILTTRYVYGRISSRTRFMVFLFFITVLPPDWKTVTYRFPYIRYNSSIIPHGFLFPQVFHHPEPGSGLHFLRLPHAGIPGIRLFFSYFL